MRQKANRILWGIVLIAAGVLLGINALDLVEINLFFEGWWTLFIIVPSVIGLLTDKDKWGAFIGLLFGVFFLLCEWDILSFDLLWKLILPVGAVLLGVSLLFGKRSPRAAKKDMPWANVTSANASRCVAVLSGQEMHYDGKPFCGADVVAVLGGVDLFASTADITADCQINVVTVLGGVEIHLPSTVNVEIDCGGICGGVDNLRRFPPIEGAPTVYIHAAAVFGGVDVK